MRKNLVLEVIQYGIGLGNEGNVGFVRVRNKDERIVPLQRLEQILGNQQLGLKH